MPDGLRVDIDAHAAGEIAGKLGAVAHGDKAELPSERKEVTVAPEILKTYAGTYKLGPKLDMVMTVEDGRLMGQVTGQEKFQLFAASETSFYLKVVEASGDFVKENGVVTHLIWHQGGRDMKAPRQ